MNTWPSRPAHGFVPPSTQGKCKGAKAVRCEPLNVCRALPHASYTLPLARSSPLSATTNGGVVECRHAAAAPVHTGASERQTGGPHQNPGTGSATYGGARVEAAGGGGSRSAAAAASVPGRGTVLLQDGPAQPQSPIQDPGAQQHRPQQQQAQQQQQAEQRERSPRPVDASPQGHDILNGSRVHPGCAEENQHREQQHVRSKGSPLSLGGAGAPYGAPPHRTTAGSPTAGEPFPPPDRSPDQQHYPSSSASSSAPHPNHGATGWVTSRSHGGRTVTSHTTTPASPNPRRRDAFLTNALSTSNWYQLRAVILSGVGAGPATTNGDGPGATGPHVFDTDPSAVLGVLRHLAAITRYNMRPPEAADLGSFLGGWLLRHAPTLRLMSPTELSLSLHALAKMAHALPAPPRGWVVAWFNAAQPCLLEAAFRPKDISLVLWAVSRLQLNLPPAALQLLLAAAEPHLDRFNGQDLSLVALALATLQTQQHGAAGEAVPHLLPSAAWQQRFLARAARVLPECGPQALANLLHGVVRAGMDLPDRLLGEFCAAMHGRLPECTPQGLANVLSALAARGHVPAADWVERFLAESAACMDGGRGDGGVGAGYSVGSGRGGYGEDSGSGYGENSDEGGAAWVLAAGGGQHLGQGQQQQQRRRCNMEDLIYLAAAVAQLRLAPPRWWTARLYGAMERQMPFASPRQLAQLMHGVALLHRSLAAAVPAASSVAAAGRTVAREADIPSGTQLATARAAAAAAHVPPPPPRSLFIAWHRAAAAALPGFNTLDAAHSLWGLAALGERPPGAWLQRLLVHCRSGLPQTPPSQLAVLVWSLSALRFKPTWAWLSDATEACGPGLGRMGGQDFAMFLTALVRLGGRPSAAWRAGVLAAVRVQMPVMSKFALSQTAWALYRLRVQPPVEWLEAVVGEQVRRWRAVAAEVRAGGSGGATERQQVLRHMVVLLWVTSLWLGEQKPRRVRHLDGAVGAVARQGGQVAGREQRPPLAGAAASVTTAAAALAGARVAGVAGSESVAAGRCLGTAGGAAEVAAIAAAAATAVLTESGSEAQALSIRSGEADTGASSATVMLSPRPVRPQLLPRPALANRPPSTQSAAAAAAGMTGELASPPSLPAVAPGPAPSSPATTAAVLSIKLRPRRRTLRRRRETRPGHLVALFAGDLHAAGTLRRRLANRLMAAVMGGITPLLRLQASVPAVAAQGGGGAGEAGGGAVWTAQDAALLLAAVRTLVASSRRAAARRRRWLPAVLEATAPLLAALPLSGLHKVLGGLASLRARVDVDWLGACCAAAAVHLRAVSPAAGKVALLRKLCGLRLSAAAPAGHHRGTGGERLWAPLLAETLEGLHLANSTSEALVRLHVELLKAGVRIRRMAVALQWSAADGPAVAGGGVDPRIGVYRAAAMRELAVARDVYRSAWQQSQVTMAHGAKPLAAATKRVREAVAVAAATVATAVAAVHDKDGRSRRMWRGVVPPISETQRPWIWNRARRTAAAHQALSPVSVVALVQLAARTLTVEPAVAATAAEAAEAAWSNSTGTVTKSAAKATRQGTRSRGSHPGSSSSRGSSSSGSGGRKGGVVTDAARASPRQSTTSPPNVSVGLVRRDWLLWLATLTQQWWPRLVPAHRLRSEWAWRRLLTWLRRQGRSGTKLRLEVAARLPRGALPKGLVLRLEVLEGEKAAETAVSATRDDGDGDEGKCRADGKQAAGCGGNVQAKEPGDVQGGGSFGWEASGDGGERLKGAAVWAAARKKRVRAVGAAGGS